MVTFEADYRYGISEPLAVFKGVEGTHWSPEF